MQLRPDQTQRFYHIWFPLLHYVNEQRQLTITFPDTLEEGSITQQDGWTYEPTESLRDFLRHVGE